MKQHFTSALKCAIAVVLVTFAATPSFAVIKKVNVQNFSFSPTSTTINLGDTMEWDWINGGHTTTSTTIPAGAAIWNAPIDLSHVKYQYIPTITGTYNFKCNFHPTMTGSFTVVCPIPSVTISANGPTTFCKGGSVTISANTGGAVVTYQWRKNGNDQAGGTNSNFVATKTGNYSVVVTNACGNSATSSSISVTVNPVPAATVTPAGPIDMCAGQTQLLSANTGANLTYQWYKGANPINNATNPNYTASTQGKYKVIVTNAMTGCNKTSNKVQINITCREAKQLPLATVTNLSSGNFMFPAALFPAPGDIYIYDLAGKIVEHITYTGSDIIAGSHLVPGMYIARISITGQEAQVIKLVKE